MTRGSVAAVATAVAVAEALSVLVGVVVAHIGFAVAADSFLVTNSALGFGCSACGVVLVRHRADNALGWLMLAAGLAQGATAAVTPWLYFGLRHGWPVGTLRTLSTLYSTGWPWAVSLFIPLVLLLFPDGSWFRPRWRLLAAVAIANACVQTVLFNADADSTGLASHISHARLHAARSWLAVPYPATLLWVSNAVLALLLVAALVALGLRYRRGDEKTRRQLLWLLFATVITLVVVVTSRATTGQALGIPVLLLTLAALIPVSVAVAVLRYQLLDIRLVWTRAVTYVLLTGAVVALYAVLVVATGSFVRTRLGVPIALTVLVAVGFNPVRVRVQRAVDRLLYGARADPVAAVAEVTRRLAVARDPGDVVPAMCAALRLPWAALHERAERVTAHGTRPDLVETLELHAAGETVGTLELGVRSGQRRLSRADRAVLELLAAPLGLAIRATTLSERIATLRDEERERMRRDLHDGLGPVLTGIAFQADAVGNLVGHDPARAGELAGRIRAASTGALDDVRRLVYALRPSALDDGGLIEAVRRHARTLDRRVSVSVVADVPPLPAAVEVVAYRIVTEALTNVVRHTRAGHVEVTFAGADELVITVQDDAGHSDEWRPGVGLRSMGERAAQVGGTVQVGPTPAGGRVQARLPIGAA